MYSLSDTIVGQQNISTSLKQCYFGSKAVDFLREKAWKDACIKRKRQVFGLPVPIYVDARDSVTEYN